MQVFLFYFTCTVGFTHAVLLTFGPLGWHRLLIAPNATVIIAIFVCLHFREDKVIWSYTKV